MRLTTFTLLGVIIFFLTTQNKNLHLYALINTFNLEKQRILTIDNFVPSEQMCFPPIDDTKLQSLQKVLYKWELIETGTPQFELNKGILACLTGHPVEARRALNHAVDIDPGNPVTTLLLAVIVFPSGDVLDTKFVSLIGEYGYIRGRTSEKIGDDNGALVWNTFAMNYQPRSNMAEKLAAIYESRGEITKVVEIWQILANARTESSPQHWWALAKIAEAGGDWATAAGAYRYGGKLSETVDRHRYFVKEGGMWFRLAELPKAENAYRNALLSDPGNLHAFLGLGDVYRLQDDLEEAKYWYQKAMDVQPDHYAPLYYLGVVAYYEQQYEIALNYLQCSLDIKPTNSGPLYYLAQTYYTLGRQDEAMWSLSKAIENRENSPESWKTLLRKWGEE